MTFPMPTGSMPTGWANTTPDSTPPYAHTVPLGMGAGERAPTYAQSPHHMEDVQRDKPPTRTLQQQMKEEGKSNSYIRALQQQKKEEAAQMLEEERNAYLRTVKQKEDDEAYARTLQQTEQISAMNRRYPHPHSTEMGEMERNKHQRESEVSDPLAMQGKSICDIKLTTSGECRRAILQPGFIGKR
jgi:hypothetical protein